VLRPIPRGTRFCGPTAPFRAAIVRHDNGTRMRHQQYRAIGVDGPSSIEGCDGGSASGRRDEECAVNASEKPIKSRYVSPNSNNPSEAPPRRKDSSRAFIRV